MATENKPAASGPTAPAQQKQPEPKPAAAPQQSSSEDDDPGQGVRAAVQEGHQARTTVPGHPGVDARLDNRAGAFRPPLESWPAKPQQIDGPDLPGQIEFTRRHLQNLESEVGPTKGQFSPGPHGLSDEKLRETDKPLYGTESLSEGDVASGAKG